MACDWASEIPYSLGSGWGVPLAKCRQYDVTKIRVRPHASQVSRPRMDLQPTTRRASWGGSFSESGPRRGPSALPPNSGGDHDATSSGRSRRWARDAEQQAYAHSKAD